MNFPLTVSVPPFLYNARDGKRYAVSAEHWIAVPLDTKFADLGKYMAWNAPELPQEAPLRSWQVEGSKGRIYTVKSQGGSWTCTCPGFGWRRNCKHVEAQKNESR